jgi:hypothetical protein
MRPAIPELFHASTPTWWAVLLLAAGLAIVAGLLVLPVMAGRGVRPTARRLRPVLACLVWVVPAVGILVLLGARVARQSEVQVMAHAPASVDDIARSVSTSRVDAGMSGTDLQSPTVLHAGVVATSPPVWTQQGENVSNDGVFVVSSQRFATLDEAEQQVTGEVVARLRQHFHQEMPYRGDWVPPVALAQAHAVRQIAGEEIDQDFGNGIKGKMYRVHVQLELSPELRNAFYAAWREQVVGRRLLVIGSLFGLMTLMLGTAACFFRLDELSGGRSRKRLQFAAAALIASGSLVVARLIG